MIKTRSKLVTMIGVLQLLNTIGCSTYTPADSIRASLVSQAVTEQWPSRDREVLHTYASLTPREVFAVELNPASSRDALTQRERFLLKEPRFRVTYCGVHANALLRIREDRRSIVDVESWARESKSIESALGFIPNSSIITSRGLTGERAERGVTLRRQALNFENQIRACEGSATRNTDVLISSRLLDGMAVRIPIPEEVGRRGLIFHFHSLHGNPGERAVLNMLAAQGWNIVHFQTDSRLATPIASDAREKLHELDTLMNSLHARLENSKDPGALYDEWKDCAKQTSRFSEGAFVANGNGDARDLGRDIATLTDDVIASNAYAAECVYLYLREHRQDLLRGPFVLMGFSAGSLVTPAIATRIMDMDQPPKIDAIVLVGSGADLFQLSRESSLTDGGITIRFGNNKPKADFLDAVHDSYREHIRLDSLVTASALHGLDVLQVHASRDGWVPARCGELLYEKLGRPDRLTVFTGHVGLFFRLGLYDDFISNWLDEHTR